MWMECEMSDKILVSRSEIEKLVIKEDKYGDWIYWDRLRALLNKAAISQAEPVFKMALDNTNLQKRINVLEDLLSSACNIANRNGEDTHWLRFAGQLHIHGISPITPKTFKILPSDDDYKPPSPPADKKDAERYRFLCKEIGYINSNYGVSYNAGYDFLLAKSGDDLNNIIDTAMKGE